jgi:hypothetical protein
LVAFWAFLGEQELLKGTSVLRIKMHAIFSLVGMQ